MLNQVEVRNRHFTNPLVLQFTGAVDHGGIWFFTWKVFVRIALIQPNQPPSIATIGEPLYYISRVRSKKNKLFHISTQKCATHMYSILDQYFLLFYF